MDELVRAIRSKRRAAIGDELIQLEHDSRAIYMHLHECSMTAGGSAEITQDCLADPPAEFMAVDIGAAEVNSAPDARIVDLVGDSREAIESARHAKHRRIRDAHAHAICLELATQHSLGCSGKTRMRGRIFGVRWRAK